MLTDEEKSRLCMACGRCCMEFLLFIRVPDFPERAEEWFQVRGIEIVKRQNHRWIVKVPLPCPHLIWGDPEHCYCDIYEDRPLNCRVYDGRLAGDRLNCKWGDGIK